MKETILRCQFCEEPLKVKDSKCEKCGAPIYVYDDADFSGDEEPEESTPLPSTKPAFFIAFYYILLLVFPGTVLSNYLLHSAYKKGTVFSDTLLPNGVSFLILYAGCVLAGRWMDTEINEGDENPARSRKLMKWNLLISFLLSGLILAGLNYCQGVKSV